MSTDHQSSYEEEVAKMLAEFKSKVQKHFEETGKPFMVHDSAAGITSLMGLISGNDWNELHQEGWVDFIKDDTPTSFR